MKLKLPYWYFLLAPTFIYYLGGALNLIAMGVNHGQMPVLMPSDVAMAMGGFDDGHSLMTSASHLKFFCDWLHLNGIGVASPGDLLIWLGDAFSTPCFAIWAVLMIKDRNTGA